MLQFVDAFAVVDARGKPTHGTSGTMVDSPKAGGGASGTSTGASAGTATVSAVGTNECYSSFVQGFGPPVFAIATMDYGFFVQDNWKVTPRLTVEMGLRYDFQSFPQPSATYTAPSGTFTPYAGLTNRPSDKNNYGPRLGFSYDVFGKGDTVLRGGFGMYYGRVQNGIILNAYLNTGSPLGQFTSPSIKPTTAGAPTFPNIISSASGSTPTSFYFASNYQNPMVEEFDLQVQQAFGKNTVFSLSYLGALGRELPNFLNVNLAPAQVSTTIQVVDAANAGPLKAGTTYTVPTYGTCTASATCPNPTGYLNPKFGAITEIISNINSNYNGMVAEIQNHAVHGVTFDANYTWSHALDDNQNAVSTTTPNNWIDPYAPGRNNYGVSQFNVGNRFVGYVLYEIPGLETGKAIKYLTNGWSINDTFQMQNGLPYSAVLQSSFNSSAALNSGWNGAGSVTYIPVIGRNTYQNPRAIVDDLRLQKAFAITERYNLKLRADVYNVANHENFNSSNLSTSAYVLAAGSGGANSTMTYLPSFQARSSSNTSGFLYTPREIQLGARLQF